MFITAHHLFLKNKVPKKKKKKKNYVLDSTSKMNQLFIAWVNKRAGITITIVVMIN